MNRTYALFSTATAPATGVWGKCYPYGVMYDQPDISKGSHLWLTVPCFDDKPLTNYTHGVEARIGQYLQNKGSFIIVARDLDDPKKAFKDRIDEKTGKITNKAFRKDIVAKTKLGIQAETGGGAVIGTYTDRFGETMEKTFDGLAKIGGTVVEYESWPLIDNPWVHQDWNGNMTVTDGKTVRLYDVTNWTITETKKE